MADICEICMKPLEHYVDGIPDYDSVVLCQKCEDKVNEIVFDGSGKDFEKCVEIVRKQFNKCDKKPK